MAESSMWFSGASSIDPDNQTPLFSCHQWDHANTTEAKYSFCIAEKILLV